MEATAGAVRTAFIADNTQFSPTLVKMIRQSKELGAAATDAGKKVAQAGHAGVAPWQASSAALRVVEGNMTNNIRAAERFLATIPGVGKALQAAFPVIGGIALLGVFSSLVGKVDEFVRKTQQMPNKLASGFSALSDSLETSNDELSITKDRLDKSIAVLEKRPFNGMVLALDESKLAADKLYGSLEKDRAKMAELMKENGTNGFSGWFSRTFENRGDTRVQSGTINSYNDQIDDLSLQQRQALHTGDTAGAARLKKQIHDKEQSAYNAMIADIKMRQGKATDLQSGQQVDYSYLYGNQTSNINTDKTYASMMLGRMNQSDVEDSIDANTKRQGADENKNKQAQLAKENASKAAEARRKVLEAQRQANAAQRQVWQENLVAQNADHTKSIAGMVAYWEAMMKTVRLGSANFVYALQKANESYAGIRKITDNPDADAAQQFSQSRLSSRWFGADSIPKTDVATQRKANYYTQRQAISDSHESRSLQIARMQQTGQMSDHDAAIATATNDAKAFSEQGKLLTDTLHDINKVFGNTLTQAERDLESKPYRAAALRLPGSKAAQLAKDANGVEDTTWQAGVSAGAKSFFDQYSPSNIGSNITGNTLSSVNSSITSGITTGKFYGASMVRGIAGNIGNNALGGLETKFLGPTFAKMGTKNNPMWTKSADSVAPAAASGLSSLLHHSGGSSSSPSGSGIGNIFGGIKSLFSSSGKSSDGSSGGGILGKLFSVATSIPFLAGGGEMGSGMAAIIGENGPELFKPKNAGTVIPNHKISSAMGSGQNITVDARGAMDPAATATAVSNAIHASARATQRSTVRSQHETKMRSPAHA